MENLNQKQDGITPEIKEKMQKTAKIAGEINSIMGGREEKRKRVVVKAVKERSSGRVTKEVDNDYEESQNYKDFQEKKTNKLKKSIDKLLNNILDKNVENSDKLKTLDDNYNSKQEIDNEKQEFLKKISDYREKERFYNEEKIRLENLLLKLNEELKLSQQKDEEDYLISLEPEKEKLELKNNAGLEEVQEENEEKINGKDNETPEEEILSDVNKIIEEIPNEEKKIIEKTMMEDSPMEFESPKVKTNYKDFIKNNIVKLVSGFKISPKIKNIIEKNAKKVLLTTAILTLWTGNNSFVKPNGVKGDISLLKNKEIAHTINNKLLETVDIGTYNKLSENGKRIYLYADSKIEGNYVIIDKPSATLSIIGADKKLVCQIPILLGKTKGETPNMANPNSDIAVEATTPAGKYTMGILGINEEDNILYKGKIFNICGSDGLALHITYPLEKEKRTKALNTLTTDDNRLSWGCINVSEEMWAEYIEGNIKNRGTYMFITPDDPLVSLNPETGQIEKKNGNNNLLAMNNINN